MCLSTPSGMSVSSRSPRFVGDTLREHRRATRTRWRVLSSGRQALMVLAHLRKGETYRDLAVGFGVGTTTAHPIPTQGAAGPRRPGADPGPGQAAAKRT